MLGNQKSNEAMANIPASISDGKAFRARAWLVSSFEASSLFGITWSWMQDKTWGGEQEQLETDLWRSSQAKQK